MNKTHFKKQNNGNNIDPIINQVFQLRHQTFIERLEWDITSENGYEKDQFDLLDAVHIAVTDEEENVCGCWRALPTTNDYMLKDVFPQLLQGEDAPQQDNVWEISRFAVKKHTSKPEQGNISNVSLDLVRSFYDFAKANDIDAYVTVTTVACERMLRQLGLNLRRLGQGKSMQVGKERSVALWIEVDDNLKIARN